MALLLHYTGQDYISRGLLNAELTPGSTSAIVGGCKTGKGFAFDGTMNSALSVLMPSEPIVHSFSLWFRITDITQTRYIATFGQNNFLQFQLWQRTNGEFVFGYLDPDGIQVNVVLNSNLPRNVWYHFAAAIDGRIMRFYLNGVLLQTHTASQDVRKGSDRTIRLGSGTVHGYLLGQICNFKYYNHALSQKEINEDYKSLMLHYPLGSDWNRGFGYIRDVSGFQRDITNMTRTTTFSNERRVYEGSESNDGSKLCYGNLDLSELNGKDTISLSCRVRFSQDDGTQCLFITRSAGTGLNEGLGLFRTSGQYVWRLGGRIAVNAQMQTGRWYDIVGVFDNGIVTTYVDGVQIGSPRSSSESFLYGLGEIFFSIATSITDNETIGSYLNGQLQDIRFYAKALTQADVTELYQTRQEIDNLANGYCYELVEGQSEVEMKANGQLYCDELIENDTGTFEIVQNKTIKTKEIKEV